MSLVLDSPRSKKIAYDKKLIDHMINYYKKNYKSTINLDSVLDEAKNRLITDIGWYKNNSQDSIVLNGNLLTLFAVEDMSEWIDNDAGFFIEYKNNVEVPRQRGAISGLGDMLVGFIHNDTENETIKISLTIGGADVSTLTLSESKTKNKVVFAIDDVCPIISIGINFSLTKITIDPPSAKIIAVFANTYDTDERRLLNREDKICKHKPEFKQLNGLFIKN